ncbi:MAG: hypothetical protein QJR02_10195 [Sinobacteraceae bacterium]|nr:hypothetical protein [Nevskiaceae bacterium]
MKKVGMTIPLNGKTTLRTDSYQFWVANQGGWYTSQPRELLEIIDMKGFASRDELVDMARFCACVESCQAQIRGFAELRYDQFSREFEIPIADFGASLGRDRIDIYSLHLNLPWRRSCGRYHAYLNPLLDDLLLFELRRSECATFAEAMERTRAITDRILAWRSELPSSPHLIGL